MAIEELKPFAHQEETIINLEEQFSKRKKKALVVLPSGSGKTHTVAFHVDKVKPKTFLYIVHRNEILFQSKQIFKEVCGWKDEEIGIINTDYKQFDRPYLFATVQTLYLPHNLGKMSHDIDYVAMDEYHHSAAESYQKVLHYFRNVKRFVGMTATPYRLDELDILDYVGNNIAHQIDLFEGIEKKILVPFHYIGLYDDIDYSKIKFSGYSYKITDLDRKLVIHKRDEAVIKEYKEKVEPRPTIAFCNSINHMNRITSKFRTAGISAASISWHEKYDKRKEIVDGFRKGLYKVLFTRDILNEGVDFPECGAVMFLRPTISKSLFFQQLGRGLRNYPGKKDVLVLDFIGNYVRAFEKRTWFPIGIKLGKYTGRFFKPDYEYDYPKPVVEFDTKVIEVMEMQRRFKQGEITKQDLYDDYMNCCAMEKVPFLTGRGWRMSKYRTIGIHHMHNLFKEFRFFLQEFNITPTEGNKHRYSNPHAAFNRCDNKELLTENYYKVKELWNSRKDDLWRKQYLRGNGGGLPSTAPPAKLLDDHHVSSYASVNYSRLWGNYRIFLNEIGELDRKTLITPDLALGKGTPSEDREKKIRIAIKRLQEKLGREYFTQSEWREHMGGYAEKEIRDVYGAYKNFREHFGVPQGTKAICEICNNEMLLTRNNDTKTCGSSCYRKWVKKNRIDPRWEKTLAKIKDLKINCKFCGKETSKYTIFNGVKKRNHGMRAKTFCNPKCTNRYNYYQRMGRDRPMSREERSKFVSEQQKSRWASYSPEQKKHMVETLRKQFVEKFPDYKVPVTKKTREKMKDISKRLYPTRHIINGRFAKKDETEEDVKKKQVKEAKERYKRIPKVNGKFAKEEKDVSDIQG